MSTLSWMQLCVQESRQVRPDLDSTIITGTTRESENSPGQKESDAAKPILITDLGVQAEHFLNRSTALSIQCCFMRSLYGWMRHGAGISKLRSTQRLMSTAITRSFRTVSAKAAIVISNSTLTSFLFISKHFCKVGR